MIIHCGYKDGSGEYFLSIDTDKCDSCAKCVKQCPGSIIEIQNVMIDIEEKPVAMVKEEFRKKIKYACLPCKDRKEIPCMAACAQKAISLDFKQ